MIPLRNPELNKLSKLFAAADDGTLTLPDEVTQARLTVTQLQSVVIQRPDEGAAHQQAVDDAIAAASAGKPFPTPSGLLKARAAAAEADAQRVIHTAALESAQQILVSSILGNMERILTEHARPALTKVLAKATTAAAKATGDGDRVSLLNGTPANMAAWRDLEALSSRYQALRAVQRILTPNLSHDVDGLFFEFRDGLRSLWSSAPHGSPPWPETPSARLRWLTTCGAELWLPTGEERDRAWLDVYGNDLQKSQARALAS